MNTGEVSYSEQLSQAVDVSLSPRTYQKYTEDALGRLVIVVGDLVEDYKARPVICFDGSKETEDAAVAYFEVPMVPEYLDKISSVTDEMLLCDAVLRGLVSAPRTILPAGEGKIAHGDGSDTFTQEHRPKTATTLFILSHHFGLNINPDAGDISIVRGTNKKGMVRKLSYTVIEAQSLSRAIFVCDLKRNITFVFDTKELAKINLNTSMLAGYMKDDIHALIENWPQLGVRVSDTNGFVRNIGKALGATVNPKFLRSQIPDADADMTNLSKICQKYGLDFGTVKTVIDSCRDTIGETKKYLFGRTKIMTEGFTAVQQRTIEDALAGKNYLLPKPPEGVTSVAEFARQLGASLSVVQSAISGLDIGEMSMYRFRRSSGVGLTESQRTVIADHLRAAGKIADEPPQGTISLSEFERISGIRRIMVEMALKSQGVSIDDVPKFSFPYRRASTGITPELKEIIFDFTGGPIEEATDGLLSPLEYAESRQIGLLTVKKALEENSDTIGTIRYYRGGKTTRRLLSLAQQEILDKLSTTNFMYAPDEYLSKLGMARRFGVPHRTITAAINDIGDELGDVTMYRFRTKTTEGYSPEQIDIVESRLRSRGKIT